MDPPVQERLCTITLEGRELANQAKCRFADLQDKRWRIEFHAESSVPQLIPGRIYVLEFTDGTVGRARLVSSSGPVVGVTTWNVLDVVEQD